MRLSEARWIADQLARLPEDQRSPLVNVGSSTHEFRTKRQPHIDSVIFAPLRARKVEVIHTDLKADSGVDIAGDLFDSATQERIRERKPRALLSSNLLEHVPDPRLFARAMTSLVPEGGHLVVTVPRSYPYHADPIDTMYRPAPEELAALFTSCTVVRAETVNDITYAEELVQKGPRAVKSLVGALRPWGAAARAQRDRLRWLFRPFTTSCVVLRVGR